MINIVSFLYFFIAAVIGLMLIWRIIKSKSLTEAVSLAIVLIPIALRALKLK